ncbi:MAG: helix-turn-helix domain-containing protein [Alphaproteobacteria bacterium]|nr:helix-turn-helix domain-containing protein [Alphaproteobacteria bacterium]
MDINEQIFDGRTAGEILKTARTTGRRKRELATIARVLCIREEFLEALEEGQYSKIPELVYILGFARNYAIELELDPKIVVGKIKYELGILQNPDDIESENEEGEDEITEMPIVPVSKPMKVGVIQKITDFVVVNWKTVLAFVGALAIILAVLFALVGKVSYILPSGDEVATTEVETATAPSGIEFRIPVRESFGTANRANANVVLQATAESWVRIEDARGETVFSRVLTRGDVYYVPTTNVRATVGNAGGLDVWVNGQLAPALGADNVRRSGIVMTPAALMGN